MINAEMRGAIQTACEYAKVLLRFIGVPIDKIPQEPIGLQGYSEAHAEWKKHYFKMLEVLGGTINSKLAEVRKKYNKANSDIPSIGGGN